MSAPTTTEELSAWLKDLRERSGLTQREAAIKAGVEIRSVRRYENGDAPEGWLPLLELLDLYGVLDLAKLPAPSAEEIARQIARGESSARARRASGPGARRAASKRRGETGEQR